MNFRRPQTVSHSARRGSILPGVVIAILVSGSCLALVLNEYWLSNSQEELRTATQAAALAAAHQLATDDLLREDVDPQLIADQVREVGQALASWNQVTGPHFAKLDFHLGRVVFDPNTGQQQTLETDDSPNAVIVVGHRDRSRGNPVALLAPVLTGQSFADVTVTVEASITNLIAGVRPFGAADVPAWPLAILEISSDSRVQTWNSQIELRQGVDEYSWNEETQAVEETADGLPEILLQPRGQNGTNNLFLVNVGNRFQDADLTRQFQEGWSTEDLSSFGDYFSLKPGPLDLAASDDFNGAPDEAMQAEIGQVRIMLLYATSEVNDNGDVSVEATRMVAGRLMHIEQGEDGPLITVQPGVVVTRTAVLDEDALYAGETQGNPYIYKLSITQ